MAVKEAVLPFNRFRTADGHNVDTILGPEMRSTGEVMGLSRTFGEAFAKGQIAAGQYLPTSGNFFVAMANKDKRHSIFPVKRLHDLGFNILATQGTATVLGRQGVTTTVVRKLSEGQGPNGEPTIVDLIREGQVDAVFNTPGQSSGSERADGYEIRASSVVHNAPCITTAQGLAATVQAVEALCAEAADPEDNPIGVKSLQEWAADVAEAVEKTIGKAGN